MNLIKERPKNLLRHILIICAFAGLAFFLTFIFDFINKKLIFNSPALLVQNIEDIPRQEQINAPISHTDFGLPLQLKIPKINVNSAIEYVGVTSNGAMDTPRYRDDVAWLKFGSRPGDSGSAVIAGHYGWKDRKPSAFDNLYKLRKGDKIYVEDDKGMTISFVVRENRRYDPKADALGVFSSSDGKSHLNLITCEGDWDEISQSYSRRLVVFTDKE